MVTALARGVVAKLLHGPIVRLETRKAGTQDAYARALAELFGLGAPHRVKLRIGTRGSRLALAQAREVANALTALGVETELVAITTAGDCGSRPRERPGGGQGPVRDRDRPRARDGEVDLAVHSAKDLPAGIEAEDEQGLVIAAVPERASRSTSS